MKRLAYKKLLNWKNQEKHKPLVIKGVRQVGKTWLIREFGEHGSHGKCGHIGRRRTCVSDMQSPASKI